MLDLACGDGALLAHLGAGAVGIDVSTDELRNVARAAQARAQALPFADHAFDAIACHLAFMLFDDVPQVVAELERVLVPRGEFLAVLGGGPTAEGPEAPEKADAFHHFLEILDRLPRYSPRFGDSRTRSEAGWGALMPGWTIEPFERWQLDLGGPFDEVWDFLGSNYEVDPARAEAIRAELHARCGDRVACNAVVYLARASTPDRADRP